MRGLFLLPTVYRLNASELAATKVETSLQFRTIIRSPPTEMQSMSENDFECFASTDVNTPGTMFPFGLANIRFPRSRLLARNGFELAAQSESASRSAVITVLCGRVRNPAPAPVPKHGMTGVTGRPRQDVDRGVPCS